MANAYKGEIAIELDGTVYTFAAGANALVAVEGLFSTPDRRLGFQEVIRLANGGSFTHLRGIVWAMLQRHHKGLTLEAVGDLMDAIGVETMERKFAEALALMLPDPRDLAALGVQAPTGDPPRAAQSRRAGTGPRSIATAGASASAATNSGS